MGRPPRTLRQRPAGRSRHSALCFVLAAVAGASFWSHGRRGRQAGCRSQAGSGGSRPQLFALPGRGAAVATAGSPGSRAVSTARPRLARADHLRSRGARSRCLQTVRRSVESSQQIEVLYDGLCKVCLTNKAVLESNDNDGVLRFVNIAEDDYEADDHSGVEYEDAMNELHVILPDGTIVRGTDAVFRAYQAVGLDWAVGILGSPLLRAFTDAVYRFLSDNREAISQWFPGGEDLRERIRSARFLQKGVAEGEGCSEDTEKEEDDDDDCVVTPDKL